MDILALGLTLLAVLFMAANALLRKHLLNRRVFTERELLIGQCAIGAILCAFWLVAFGAWWNILAPEKTDWTMWWIALITTTAVNVVIQFGNMRATRLADISFVTPISALTPGLLVLAVLVIGEQPGTWGLVGIVLIVIGTYAHAREGAPFREYLVPLFFWLVFKRVEGLDAKEAQRRVALRWSYTTVFFATVGLLGDGLVARHGDMILAVTIELGALALIYALFLKWTAKDEGAFAPFAERFRAHAPELLAFGISFGMIFILLGVAFRLAPIAYIGSLKRLAIFLTVIGGIWLLGEKSGTRRTLLTIVIVAGAICIVFDPSPSVVLDSADEYLRHLIGK